MRISDWSSDVCSSDLHIDFGASRSQIFGDAVPIGEDAAQLVKAREPMFEDDRIFGPRKIAVRPADIPRHRRRGGQRGGEQRPRFQERAGKRLRSEEHTSELQSLMRISYAVFCLKKKKN